MFWGNSEPRERKMSGTAVHVRSETFQTWNHTGYATVSSYVHYEALDLKTYAVRFFFKLFLNSSLTNQLSNLKNRSVHTG